MKKKILLVLLVVLLIPYRTFAKSYYEDYEHKNFKETLEVEEMELINKDYEENDKQVTIYFFRGQGCGYCRNFLTFLNSISEEYGKYFKVVSFEVWNNKDNKKLMKKVANIMYEEAGGVPYIIIGDEVFPGYISSWDEDIKAAIKEQYGTSYDVFEELSKKERAEQKALEGYTLEIILWNILFVGASTVIIFYVQNRKNKELLNEISKLKEAKNKGKK